MLGTDLREGETLELKSEWSDDALKDLAAFANTRGGTLVIGIANDGSVIGTDASDQQVQRLANQIRVYDDELSIWNPGGLPPDLRIEQLREPQHPSMPRNPLLAQAFYYAGQIEHWGTGTARIFALCREQGLPEPEFDADATQFCVRFLKDPYTPERLRKMGLNERQVQAVLYVKAHGSITNKEYQQLTGASKPTATRDLENLTIRGILERRGVTGRGTQYTLKGSETAQTAHKRLTNGSKGYNSDPS
jgi:ATP-dependent DNA helicase RecG